MKKKLTLLFALLCVSVMGWAYDLAPNTNFGSQNLQWKEIDGVNPPANVVNVQSYMGHDCLYITFSDAGFNRDYIGGGAVVYTNEGAQAWLQLESFTNENTDVLFYQTGSTTDVKWGLRIYNAAAGGGSTPDPGTIDWSTVDFVPGSTQYKVGALSASDLPNEVVNVQKPGWAEEQGIYMTFPSADQLSCTVDAAISGAGMVVYLSNFQSTEEKAVTVSWNGGSRTFYVYNNNLMTLPATKAASPAIAASNVRAVYSQYTLNTGMTRCGWSDGTTQNVIVDGRRFPSFKISNQFGLGIGRTNISMMDKLHLDIWAESSFDINVCLISDGAGEHNQTVSLTGNQWNSVNLSLDDFQATKTAVTAIKLSGPSVQNQLFFLDNIYFYSETDLPDPDPTDVYDTNFALSSNGGIAYPSTNNGENFAARAIDGDNGTQWESVQGSDPQTWTVDLGQRRIFNILQIRWEAAYARAFTISISNDAISWTQVAEETNYTTGGDNVEYQIELGENKTARYIRFNGTARATGYGYSFREFRVLLTGTPVLTSVGLVSDKELAKEEEYATLTASPKDQNNQPIAATLSYEVSPADAGHVTDGKYYPDKYGLATITVTAEAGGVQVTNNVQIWGVTSDNLALNNALTDVGTYYGGDTQAKAVDGNDGSVWQGCTTNTTSADQASRIYDAWFVVDLKEAYTLQLVTIHFEGACSDSYKLYGSTNNVDWTEIYSYEYPDPQQGNRTWNHIDEISADVMANAENVRYLKFISSRAASEWGVKICEMQVFGEEYTEEGIDVTGITLDETAATVEIGESLTLTATVSPYNATIKTVTWTSSDETVATVVDGVITTIKAGTADITATANDGSGVFATCALTVEPITAKTWWGTQTITDWDPDMDVMWSVTRNANKTLTYTVYFGGDASEKVKQINNGTWNTLAGYTDANRTASYTTETTYEKGTKIKPDHFFYFGGPRIELADVYVVGSENERPSTAVESVEISSTAASLLPEENLQLTATVLPSFVENKNVNWSSDNTSVATVSNTGYVTAVAEGTAHITATSVADGTKSATCTVTVVGSITSATWYGYSTVSPLEGLTAYTYSITRGTDHKLTFTMTTDKNVVGYVSGIEGDVTGAFGGYDAVNHTGTFTTAGTYTDGAELHLRLTFASASYGAPAYNFSYTVGSENDPLPQAVAVDEEKDNNAILTTYDGLTVIGVLGRTFSAGNLYTLVLPFDVDAAQTAAKLPGHLTKLQNTIVKENQDLRINFVDVSEIEAGVPYLYEPSAAVANPTFESVEVSATLNPTVADSYAKYYGIYAPMDGDALHAKDNAYVLGPDQYLYAVSDLPANQTMAALRAYFVLNFPPSAGAAPRRVAQVVFNSQETEVATGIENAIDNEQNAKILRDGQLLIIREGKMYNAQGQLIK